MRIEDLGYLSDCQTGALVDAEGSIVWYCPGRFDRPSVFAGLLDPQGGRWSLGPEDAGACERGYVGETMVLRTVHHAESGSVEVFEALALGGGREHRIGYEVPGAIVRTVKGLSGDVTMLSEFVPRFEYALTRPRLSIGHDGVVASAGSTDLRLSSDAPFQIDETEGRAYARFTVSQGERIGMRLSCRDPFLGGWPSEPDAEEAIEDTIKGWESWSGLHEAYAGFAKQRVKRSAIVLQALTYQPSGAVVAAATTSLPERIGGEWNWDYRYAWLRDASLMMRAEWVAACPDEPERLFWFIDRAGGQPGYKNVQIMYGVGGERDLTEHALDHLEGFEGSRPVRVGNDAWKQRQLDVLGEVLDAAYLLRDRLGDLDARISELLRSFAERACERWREPDSGMWEARDRQRHYLSSKVMCWVAVDRALRLADRIHADDRLVRRWEAVRHEIEETVLHRGWSDEVQAFTGAFGSTHLDASVLLMPLVGFLGARDERMRSTIEAVDEALSDGGLVKRWAGEENGFIICSFWLAECLALLGRIDEAKDRFEAVCRYSSDLGLLPEMGEPRTGVAVGNYPQAFSHVGLINAAWTISRQSEQAQPHGMSEERPAGPRR